MQAIKIVWFIGILAQLYNGLTWNGSLPGFLTWSSGMDFRYIFAYPLFMIQGPSTRKTFVVACKKCSRNVQTGVAEFPFQSIIVECALCGEKRRYLPSEIFLGRADQLVARQKRAEGS
jgi:hypothetical protein